MTKQQGSPERNRRLDRMRLRRKKKKAAEQAKKKARKRGKATQTKKEVAEEDRELDEVQCDPAAIKAALSYG